MPGRDAVLALAWNAAFLFGRANHSLRRVPAPASWLGDQERVYQNVAVTSTHPPGRPVWRASLGRDWRRWLRAADGL